MDDIGARERLTSTAFTPRDDGVARRMHFPLAGGLWQSAEGDRHDRKARANGTGKLSPRCRIEGKTPIESLARKVDPLDRPR
jgi:hypothetical protein